MPFEELSPNAEKLLQEIIEHRFQNGMPDLDYWKKRFTESNFEADARLRSLFKELSDCNMVNTQWAEGYPYSIIVTDRAFSYVELKERFEKLTLTSMKEYLLSQDALKLLRELCMQAVWPQSIIIAYWPKRVSSMKYAERIIFTEAANELIQHGLAETVEINNGGKILKATSNGIEYDKSLVIKEHQQAQTTEKAGNDITTMKKYDVFISHANADKLLYVNELVETILKLGVSIFYDTNEISWGDNWKNVILNGTAQSEFAIIVISENFFGREWTERELDEFLKRQHASGQKIVLPLLHDVTIDELKEKYPALGDIQVIETTKYTKEEIAILFAKELIKRLKG